VSLETELVKVLASDSSMLIQLLERYEDAATPAIAKQDVAQKTSTRLPGTRPIQFAVLFLRETVVSRSKISNQ
jgi:hypothetical protein